jgi:hypothetical protein
MKVRNIVLLIMFCCVTYFANGQQVVQRFYENSGPGSLIRLNNNNYLLTGGHYNLQLGKFSAFMCEIDSVGQISGIHEYFHPNYSLNNINNSLYDGGNYIYHIVDAYSANYYAFRFFVKSDLQGNIISCKKFNTSLPSGVVQFTYQNGRLTFCGSIDHGYVSSTLPQIKGYRFMVFQTDDNFNVLWAREYRYKIEERLLSIIPLADGSVIVQGTTYDSLPTPARQDLVTMKIDSLGNVLWAKQAGSPGFPFPGTSVAVAYAGKVVLFDNGDIINGFNTSWYNGTMMNTNNDVILQKLDSDGNEITSYRYGNSFTGEERITDLIIDYNQDIVFSVNSLLIKTNNSLIVRKITNNRISNINLNSFRGYKSLCDNQDNTISAVASVSYLTGSPFSSICFARSDSFGNMLCSPLTVPIIYNQPEIVGNFDITTLISDSLIAVTDSLFNIIPITNTFVDSLNCLSNTGIGLPEKRKIEVYPTIFSKEINIILKDNSKIKYSVFSVNGKILLSGNLNGDFNQINLTNLSKGLYFIQINTRDTNLCYKIIKNEE